MTNPVLFAVSIDGDASGTPLTGTEIGRFLKDDHLAWTHLDANNPETKAWLEKEITYLDELVIKALLAEETRPRILRLGDGILLILRGVNLNENASPEDMVSIRLWVDPHRIVSLQKRRLRAVGDIAERLAKGAGPDNSGSFVAVLVNLLFARMAPVVTSLGEEMDDIEESVIDGSPDMLREQIVSIRKKAIIFRRYMAPQRDLIKALVDGDIDWIDTVTIRRLIEAQDDITRFIEELDSIRERAQIVNDEIGNMSTERLNRNMYGLSVVAAIFLPLGFLTGLLGINIAGIPGAENPWAFLIFCGLLIGLVAAQIIIFKKKGWF
jgi:zinc transporter